MSTGRVVSHWDVPEQFLIVQWLGAMELTLHLQMCPGAWVRPPIPHTGGNIHEDQPSGHRQGAAPDHSDLPG